MRPERQRLDVTAGLVGVFWGQPEAGDGGGAERRAPGSPPRPAHISLRAEASNNHLPDTFAVYICNQDPRSE